MLLDNHLINLALLPTCNELCLRSCPFWNFNATSILLFFLRIAFSFWNLELTWLITKFFLYVCRPSQYVSQALIINLHVRKPTLTFCFLLSQYVVEIYHLTFPFSSLRYILQTWNWHTIPWLFMFRIKWHEHSKSKRSSLCYHLLDPTYQGFF